MRKAKGGGVDGGRGDSPPKGSIQKHQLVFSPELNWLYKPDLIAPDSGLKYNLKLSKNFQNPIIAPWVIERSGGNEWQIELNRK